MVPSAKDQVDVIEQFLFEIIETEEYKAVEYLAFSKRKDEESGGSGDS